ncbi:MAG: NAD(P)-dependent oxidoreductase [Candidatus Kapaibacterium sp.]
MVIVTRHIPGLAEAIARTESVLDVPYSDITNDLLRSSGATALFVRTTTPVTADLLRGTHLRFVGTASAGFDHLDIAALESNGIRWAAAPGCNAHAVAEYVLYAILRSEPSLSGSWSSTGIRTFMDSCTVGIIGYGNAGRAVARILQSLGLRILLNDPPALAAGLLTEAEQAQHRTLEEIAQNCTIITNHVPLSTRGTYATAFLLGEDFFRRVSPRTAVVHASRGGVVDERALLDAIRTKDLRASVDVWDGEPWFSSSLAHEARWCTPHIAGHSIDAHHAAADMMLRAYGRFLGRRFDDVTAPPPGPLRRHPSSFDTIDELRESLAAAFDAERLQSGMRAIADVTDAERRAHFLPLRMSYTTRREIISTVDAAPCP